MGANSSKELSTPTLDRGQLATAFWELIMNLDEEPSSSVRHFSTFTNRVALLRSAQQSGSSSSLSPVQQLTQVQRQQQQAGSSRPGVNPAPFPSWAIWEQLNQATKCEAFLEIVRTDPSLQIVRKLRAEISEQDQRLQHQQLQKVLGLRDQMGSSILHCMAHALAYRISCNEQIPPYQWEIYREFSSRGGPFFSLQTKKNVLGQTADQIIEKTGVAVGEVFFTIQNVPS